MTTNNLFINQMIILQSLKTKDVDNIFIQIPYQKKKTHYYLLGLPNLDKKDKNSEDLNKAFFDGFQVYNVPPYSEQLKLSFIRNANYNNQEKEDNTFMHNTVFHNKQFHNEQTK